MSKNSIYKTYNNAGWNIYLHGDKSPLYGLNDSVPDPFVMRYDGYYYLYCTTSGLTNSGIQGWKSIDLVNWAKINCSSLPLGFVCSPENKESTTNAYAPEVYYFNGYFYMYISPGGFGHRILRSKSPEGPFEAVTGKLDDKKIDGSLYITDDEKFYFLFAGHFGIFARELSDPITYKNDDITIVKNTDNINGWTEGPMAINRNNNLFLSYTGHHYLSLGYRIEYSTSKSSKQTDFNTFVNGFEHGLGNRLLMNAEKCEKISFTGLGHSAFVLGPNLDALYMSYHSIKEMGNNKVIRSFNIDRVFTSDEYMTCVHKAYGSLCPEPAKKTYRGLTESIKNNSFYLFDNINKKHTIEYNFTGKTQLFFSYINENDYYCIDIKFENKRIGLLHHKDNKDMLLSSGYFIHDFSYSDLHTVLVINDLNSITIYFDNMKKIDCTKSMNKGGRFGYLNCNANVGSTSYSEYAYGDSDISETKPCEMDIPACLSNFTKSAHVVKEEKSKDVFKGAPKLMLNNNEYLENNFYISSEGNYFVSIYYSAVGDSVKFDVILDGKKVAECNKDNLNSFETFNEHIYGLKMSEGIHTLRIITKESIGVYSFGLFASHLEERFILEKCSVEGKREYKPFTEYSSDFDFDISIDRFNAGAICLKTSHVSVGNFDNLYSERGYLLVLGDNILLTKVDYGYRNVLVNIPNSATTNIYNIKIINDLITLTNNGDILFSIRDNLPFKEGRCGLLSDNCNLYAEIKDKR